MCFCRTPGRTKAQGTSSPWVLLPVLADLTTGIPDSAPPGLEEWVSPIVVPAPAVRGTGDWSSAVARARKFVAQLTIEEKVNVTTGVDIFGRCVGNTGRIPRLNWPGLCMQDSPLGVRFADFVSAFPAGINAAATWDVNLIRARGVAMAEEHRGKGVNAALGPMCNMGRQAAAGRQWEGFGSDPFLTGVATAATIEGMQSVGVIATVKHFIANEQEHMRGGSEHFPIASSNIDDRTMHEVYLWPFAEAVKVGVGSVMCSYNLINQTQACQNSKLMNGILKEELGFQGFIMSDWAAMINGVQPALAGLDMNMPGFIAYGLGDQNAANPSIATNSWWGAALIEMVNNGSVPMSRVDDMVTRIVATWYKFGQDKGYPEVNFDQRTQNTFSADDGTLVNEHVNVQGDHYKLIREMGAASTVLLKNVHGALPLSAKKLKRVGCDEGTLAMGFGSGTATFPYLIDPLSAITAHIRSLNRGAMVEGVLSDFAFTQNAPVASNADACLVFVNADSGEGYITVDGNAGDRNNLTLWHAGDALIANVAAQCANTIVVQHVVGPVLVEAWIDHPNVTAVLNAGLPGQETGNAIVDVLFSDSPEATNPSARLPYTVAKRREDYPADILYATNQPPGVNSQITYEERWFDAQNIAPRFEFGFGLSYTTFGYSGLHVSVSGHHRRADAAETTALSSTSHASSAVPASSLSANASSGVPSITSIISVSAPGSLSISASVSAMNTSSTSSALPASSSPIGDIGGPAELYTSLATVSFTLTNTGRVAGSEVAQLYLTFPERYAEPPRILRGFAKVFLRPGESKHVSIPLRVKDLSVWDVVKQKWVGVEGRVGVMVGASSRDARLTGSLDL
ncbi:Fn3-like domain-containing protein [Mycena kentingensis (nom. inval.)]|nr:Fn3-like domain-containing protein [Mycena kentingensis (nom. inval.)]